MRYSRMYTNIYLPNAVKVKRREFDDPRTVHKAEHATKVIELI